MSLTIFHVDYSMNVLSNTQKTLCSYSSAIKHKQSSPTRYWSNAFQYLRFSVLRCALKSREFPCCYKATSETTDEPSCTEYSAAALHAQSVVLNQLGVQIDVRTLYLQDWDRTFAPQLCLMVINLARSAIILEGEHTLQTPLGRAEVTKVPAAEMNHMNLIRFAT